jgi:hypothetical protein
MSIHPSSDRPYPTYFHLLADVHRRLRPARYLEIGVNEGHSLAFVGPGTRIVGVDPEPRIGVLEHPDWTVVPVTSEEFFESHDVEGLLGGPVDLAFVDGLHHFEVALADVLAVERHAHSGTVVLVHDVLPIDAVTSTRERTTTVWSGDVWKAVVILRRHRPDLTVTTLDVEPTGMAVVTGFGKGFPSAGDDSRVVSAVDALLPATHHDLLALGTTDALGVVDATPENLAGCLPL